LLNPLSGPKEPRHYQKKIVRPFKKFFRCNESFFYCVFPDSQSGKPLLLQEKILTGFTQMAETPPDPVHFGTSVWRLTPLL
jgi:hypothetical protein